MDGDVGSQQSIFRGLRGTHVSSVGLRVGSCYLVTDNSPFHSPRSPTLLPFLGFPTSFLGARRRHRCFLFGILSSMKVLRLKTITSSTGS